MMRVLRRRPRDPSRSRPTREAPWRSWSVAALLASAGLAAQQPAADDAGQPAAAPTPEVVGRAFPSWRNAVLLREDAEPTPLEPRYADRLSGRPLLVVAAREGEARAADLEAARAFAPVHVDRAQRRRVGLALALADRDQELPPRSPVLSVHVPDLDTLYAAPARPWVAIHDRRGLVAAVVALSDADRIRAALHEALDDRPNPGLVGTPMEPLSGLVPRDLPDGPDGTPDLDLLRAPPGGLVLYRFWTDGCPHCRASLPALTALADRFESFRLVPVHHRKSPIERSEAWLRDYLGDLGVEGPWAEDPEWATLKKLMERGNLRTATSVSFLVDEHGVVRWVHRGPRVHPDPEGEHGSAGEDFAELEGIVARWCGGTDGEEDAR